MTIVKYGVYVLRPLPHGKNTSYSGDKQIKKKKKRKKENLESNEHTYVVEPQWLEHLWNSKG